MYEVFITCKRTDMDGGLSKDFKIAEHLYHLLCEKGISTFFSEKSLSSSDFIG